MSKTAATKPAATRKASAPAAGLQRCLVGIIGILSLAAGVAALLIGSGLLGAERALEPVLGLTALDTLHAHRVLAGGIAIAGGLVLFLLGLLWAGRDLTPETRPGLVLDPNPECRLEISAVAMTDAVSADAATIEGVSQARARMAGTMAAPVVRLQLWLRDGTDVRNVYHELDTRVLARARESLGVSSLPAAIRIELEAAAPIRVR
ncbi:MAG: alkaline shock response membrane anchor protein AmaP [Pseudonocardiaceae bacterium]